LELQQLLGQLRQTLVPALGRTQVDDDALALDVPELAQSSTKRLEDGVLNEAIQLRLDQEPDTSRATHDLGPDGLRRRQQGKHRHERRSTIHDRDSASMALASH